MPPSPALRCSPKRMENTHKRDHSFESGMMLIAKDDDLALFNDMQNKERENFLLHTADDFDDSLSKLRYLTDFKLGITIPAPGERRDLLYEDGDKNDYDWLLTPPDTPLFPSLDDEEEPQPHKPPSRGRPRSQPVNVSRSLSMNEKACSSSRSSASPRHLSSSPRSNNNIGKLTSRPSSAPRSSPPPILRPATPSRRPSTPNRPSTPTPRSSTPTPRRMSTGSSGPTSSSYGKRGTSPMRASRGNSASPKLRAWQQNLPGFSSDAPPNLRTSISDRPAPLTRGLSPTPRNGRGRHSMSPSARSASSSRSNERDLFSSYSKGSVVSSGDDDVDSLLSLAISSNPPTRRNGMSENSRAMAFSKKPLRSSPANSAPKISFESVIRQMDHRKTPQNMFRPLLSSVPATTFYVGKANNTNRPMFSRTSSLTTSTSASSDQGTTAPIDMEGSEHDQNDPDTQEEVFIFDKADDDVIKDIGLHAGNPLLRTESFNVGTPNKIDAHEFASESIVDSCEIMVICSKCGKRFRVLRVDGETDVCEECSKIDALFAAEEPLSPLIANQNQTVQSKMAIEMDISVNETHLPVGVSELREIGIREVVLAQHKHAIEQGLNYSDNGCAHQSELDVDQQIYSQQDVNSTYSGSGNKFEHTDPSLRIHNPEGTGISVLLPQRPSTSKWPIVQSRAFSATNFLSAESTYARDNTSVMRRSFGRDNASASSSVDLGSSRQTDICMQRQYSGSKIEVNSVRSDTDVKSQCSGSHSNLTINPYKPSVPPENDTAESLVSFAKGGENEALPDSDLVIRELDSSLNHRDTTSVNFSSCRENFVDGDVLNTSDSQILNHTERHHYETSAAGDLKDEDFPSSANAMEDPWTENESSLGPEATNTIPDSSIISEQSELNGPACRSDISDAATNRSVILESENDDDGVQYLQTECAPAQTPSNVEGLHEHSVSTMSEKGVVVSTLESELVDHAHGINEESTVIVEGSKGHTSKSLTLSEATDTILFCSSIIHDIAYKAATIAIENEPVVPQETPWPMVTILGNDSRKLPNNKNTPKSQKLRKRKVEAPTKSPLKESGMNVIVQESKMPLNSENGVANIGSDSMKPPMLESKCNCVVM